MQEATMYSLPGLHGKENLAASVEGEESSRDQTSGYGWSGPTPNPDRRIDRNYHNLYTQPHSTTRRVRPNKRRR